MAKKYFTQEEIAQHNSGDDCWVSIFDKVYNLTSLIANNRNALSLPIIEAAGTNISHWFNEKTGDYKTYIDPKRNIAMPYTPQGRFLHVPPPDPRDNTPAIDLPWWKDNQYIIGSVTKLRRLVRIVNMLSKTEDVINTCVEETINDIRDRFLEYNSHGKSYTWKSLINDDIIPLDMTKTLEQNGIVDETDKFLSLGMNDDYYIPTLHIYFNDDLTYA